MRARATKMKKKVLIVVGNEEMGRVVVSKELLLRGGVTGCVGVTITIISGRSPTMTLRLASQTVVRA